MTLIKKTIILSSTETEGYCTIVRVGSDIGAKVVGNKFTPDMRVGIKIGTQTTYVGMLKGQKTEISLPLSFTQNDNIGCLVLSNDTIFAKGGIYIAKSEVLLDTTTSSDTVDTATVQISPEKSQEILDNENDILQRLGGEDIDFYANAKDKLAELFIIYPPEKNLNTLIPDSSWVKISYDGDDYYVVGKLLSDGKLSFIGYGVPGIKAVAPPKITDGYADWLSVENIKPYDGYWLIFQNVKTGKMSNLS